MWAIPYVGFINKHWSWQKVEKQHNEKWELLENSDGASYMRAVYNRGRRGRQMFQGQCTHAFIFEYVFYSKMYLISVCRGIYFTSHILMVSLAASIHLSTYMLWHNSGQAGFKKHLK